MLDFSLIEHLRAAATLARGEVSTGDVSLSTPMPALVIERVTGQRNRTLGGRALFARASVLLTSVGGDAESALSLNQQAHAALDGFRGIVGQDSPTTVQSCLSEAEASFRLFRDGDLVRYLYSESFRIVFVAN